MSASPGRDSEIAEQYRLLVAMSPDAILVASEGLVRAANPAAYHLFEASGDELQGLSVASLVHPDDLADTLARLASIAAGDTDGLIEPRRLITRRGNIRYGEVAAGPVTHEGRPAVQAMIRDVTGRREAESTARAMEQSLAQVFMTVRAFAITLDLDGTIIFCNDALLDATGWTFGEVAGRSWFDLFVPPESGLEADYLRAIAEDCLTEHDESEVMARDGRRILVAWDHTLLRSGDGVVTGTASMGRDVTELRRQEALHDADRSFKTALIESSADGIIAFDREFRYTIWNPAMERMSGLPASAVIGHNAFELFPFIREHGQDVQYANALSGESSVQRDLPYVVPSTGKAGWNDAHFAPLLVGEGAIVGGLVVVHDVTSRHERESLVASTNLRFRTITRLTRSMLYDEDLATGVVTRSDALHEAFGYSPSDVEPTVEWWLARVHPDDIALARDRTVSVLADDTDRWSVEYRVRCKDGRYAWVMDRGMVARDEHGLPARVVGMATDMSERRELEERVRQAQKMEAVGQLAGGIAHDFNNVLTAIACNAQFALDTVDTTEDERLPAVKAGLRGDLDDILQGIRRATSLTRQLLTFSSRQIVQPVATDVAETVRNISRMLRRMMQTGTRLEEEHGSTDWRVMADPMQLDQIVMNLVMNARAASDDNASIELRTFAVVVEHMIERAHGTVPLGEYLVLSVRDHGTGMSPDTVDHLFEPFFTTKSQGEGTGLGLATVHGIVQQMRGFVTVDTKLGEGSTFAVYLPRCGTTDEGTPTPREEAPAHRVTILVVDDETALRDVAQRVLRRAGYRVLTAANGREALACLDRDRTDSAHEDRVALVLTDLMMPEMGGVELAGRMKESDPGIPVLFMSGYAPEALVREGIAVDTGVLLQKPFSIRELEARVREALTLGAIAQS